MRVGSALLSALLIFGSAAPAVRAQQSVSADTTLPRPVGWVNDFAHAIAPAKAAQIESVIRDVNARCGGAIVVVTLPTLGGRSRDEVALRLGRGWKVGRAGEVGDTHRGTGAVVLVVPAEHEWKIELGTRTGTFVTAAQAGEIGREQMVPAFQRGDYGEGILRGVTALARRYADEYHFQLAPVPAAAAPAVVFPPPMAELPPREDDLSGVTLAIWLLIALGVGVPFFVGAFRTLFPRRRSATLHPSLRTTLRTTRVPPDADAYRARPHRPLVKPIPRGDDRGAGRETRPGSAPGGGGWWSWLGAGGGATGGGGAGGGGGGGADFGGGGDFSGGGAGGHW